MSRQNSAASHSTPLRVGLAGAGMISWYHLVAWSRTRGAKVVAVCDPALDRAEARARKFGVAAVYSDAKRMLEAEHLDALDVATPVETHAALIGLAVEHEVDVLCQKPLTPTLAAAEVLVAGLGSRSRLMVHENWRFRPYYRDVATWIGEEKIGRLQQGCLAALYSGLLPDASGRCPELEREPSLRSAQRLLIGGLLIHHLDVMRWLLGPLQVLAARAARTSDEVAAETMATIMLQTEAGAPVVVAGNMAAPGLPVQIIDRLELIGTSGRVTLFGNRLELSGAHSDAIEYDLAAAYQESFDRAVQHFTSALLTGAEFETNPLDNLETLRLVEASYAAASSVGA
jgi:predicted dehydrogenase